MDKMMVIVAAHKEYWMPEDSLYTPLQVGAVNQPALKSWQRDDDGEHISEKNSTFCELTGLYWMWKNVDADIYGLVHYRRHLTLRPFGGRKEMRILTCAQAQKIMEQAGIVLPKKRHYWIETNASQYVHAHHAEDLARTKEIITELCPEYLPAWDQVMRRTSGHRFNMFLMRKEYFQAYCTWLFEILFELERTLDIRGYSPKDQRVFGYVAERLLDIWLEKNRYPYREIGMVHLEPQHWGRKIMGFLARKFTRKPEETVGA